MSDSFGNGLVTASPADMARQLSNHGPSGDAWPDDPDSVYQQQLLALAPTFARLNDRANYLVSDMFPGTSVELLPEWERSVGLPDPCSGPDPTIALRQLHVLTRLTYRGGQSIPYFTAYAAALGYAITVTEFVPARADYLHADDPDLDLAWAYAWQVNVPALTINYFTADNSYADEPLATWGYSSLVCELNRIKPAHTILNFVFGQPLGAVWGTGRWGVDTWGADLTAPLGSFVLGQNTLA